MNLTSMDNKRANMPQVIDCMLFPTPLTYLALCEVSISWSHDKVSSDHLQFLFIYLSPSCPFSYLQT
jgi:hypothetical protein